MKSRRHVWLGVSGFVAVGVATSHTAAAPRFSEWSTPVHLVALSSTAGDIGPAISKDGRSLYFSSNRPDSIGDQDIYVSQRASADDAWAPPVNIGAPVNSTSAESVPAFSRDGHWMFFNSDRPGSLPGMGGMSNLDIWASWRADPHDDFAWRRGQLPLLRCCQLLRERDRPATSLLRQRAACRTRERQPRSPA